MLGLDVETGMVDNVSEADAKAVLEKLSAERSAEHEGHDWYPVMHLKAVQATHTVPGYLMSCDCGWQGWIIDSMVSVPGSRGTPG